MWISKYFLWFVVFSIGGWIWESIYCTSKKGFWENRGFLFGPVCPIYGVGGAGIIGLYEFVTTKMGITPSDVTWWKVFLISFFGSIILEYSTSYVLEKLFHAVWWDYSKMPFNIHGRVCLPASILFGCAGVLIVKVLMPPLVHNTSQISPIMIEFLGLIAMALIAADTTLTVSVLTRFGNEIVAMEARMNKHMEQFVASVQEKKSDAEEVFEGALQERKAAFEARLLEESQRFSVQSADEFLDRMSGMYGSTLKRVQGFRPVENIDKRKEIMEGIADKVKQNLHKKDRKK